MTIRKSIMKELIGKVCVVKIVGGKHVGTVDSIENGFMALTVKTYEHEYGHHKDMPKKRLVAIHSKTHYINLSQITEITPDESTIQKV
ncbi:hypothetical protein UE98_19180 [Burkholderia cenocepacia]|nr:hypothetical protein UE98_19180 [Burkholderia cenocepacia]